MSCLEDALEHCLAVVRLNARTLAAFPDRCEGGRWVCVDPDARSPVRPHWVDGFWVGLLWLAYAHTGEGELEAAARQWAARLAWLRDDLGTHDLGFLFGLSHVLGARISGDASLLDNALAAARTTARRYNPRGEYLQAWGTPDGSRPERGRTIIDVMTNLGLLFWASAHSRDPVFARLAACHARTSRLVLVRPDGSTAQVADFDPDSGAFLRQDTHQGWSPASCWSRGHAWGLYGFAATWASTGDEVFLCTARRLAEYALRRAPADLVPYWDYDCPDIPATPRDSSAAAVLAAGLLELAAAEPDPGLAGRWRGHAEALLHSLWHNYSARPVGWPCFLLHGSRSVPHGLADSGLIYGDYYLLEALTRLLRPHLRPAISFQLAATG